MRLFLAIFFLIFLHFCAGYSDTGIPMLVFIEPVLVGSLVGVVIVEAFVISRRLSLPFKKIIKAVAVSNIVSTLVGVPLTWLVLCSLEVMSMLIFGFFLKQQHLMFFQYLIPAWLIGEGKGMISLAFWSLFYMTTVFFCTSSWIEFKINAKKLSSADPKILKKATWEANFYSYTFLCVLMMGYFFLKYIARII